MRLPNWELEKLRMEHEKKQAELTRQREKAAYWKELEHQYAGMAMQGILSNPCIADEIDKEGIVTKPLFIAEMAKAYAHTLVEKLKSNE